MKIYLSSFIKKIQFNKMEFETIDLAQWKALVNAQLKKGTIEDYDQIIPENILMEPYDDEQNLSKESSFSSNPIWLSDVKFQNPYSQKYIGKINAFLTTLTHQGIVEVNSLKECMEIEENFENNEFQYWVDLFYQFETQEDHLLDMDAQTSIYDTISEDVVAKVKWVIDIVLPENSGAAYTTQLSIALAKLNELVAHFSPVVLSNIVFKIAVGTDFLTEIAKIKALRLVFNSYCSYFGVEASIQIMAESTERNKTSKKSENNLIRSSIETSAAIIGGVEMIKFAPYTDEKEADWANDVSLKQGIIATQEAILQFFDDAMAGSYMIEKMSKKIAEESWSEFQEIEKNQGYRLDFNRINEKVQSQLTKWIEKVNDKKIVIIGVNEFNEGPFQLIKIPKKSKVFQPFKLSL